MNKHLIDFARKYLKDSLAKLPKSWHETFVLMYGRDNERRSVEEAKALDINDVVDNMPTDKLDWAMCQVDNSLSKLKTQEVAVAAPAEKEDTRALDALLEEHFLGRQHWLVWQHFKSAPSGMRNMAKPYTTDVESNNIILEKILEWCETQKNEIGTGGEFVLRKEKNVYIARLDKATPYWLAISNTKELAICKFAALIVEANKPLA